MLAAIPAAYHITFLGTQPRLTQVPPIFPFSTTAHLAPYLAALSAIDKPPLPPPIAIRS